MRLVDDQSNRDETLMACCLSVCVAAAVLASQQAAAVAASVISPFPPKWPAAPAPVLPGGTAGGNSAAQAHHTHPAAASGTPGAGHPHGTAAGGGRQP